MRLTREALVFHVSEAGQGPTDLNGDGDASDAVLHLHDLVRGRTRSLGLSAWEFTQANGLVALEAYESLQGQDLNGDADLDDFVAHVHDIAADTTWNLGLETDGILTHFGLPYARVSPFQVRAGWVAVPALESALDFNGDGDREDTVLFLADTASRRIIGSGLATAGSPFDDLEARKHRLLFHPAAGGALSFLVSEAAQGEDRNGDGDLLDLVLHFLDPDTGTLLSSGASAVSPLLPARGRSFPFLAPESGDGVDLNGDGDTLDTVLRVARVRL